MPTDSTPATLLLFYLTWVLALSVITATMIRLDKRRAERNRPRIAERTLHMLELLGGFPGALWAMRRYRHKTRKPRYLLATGCMIVLHLAAVASVATLALTSPR